MYGTIRRAAYVLAPEARPWTESYRALPRPELWHDGPLRLCNHGRDESQHFQTAPTGRLDGLLQTLAPDLVVRPRPRQPAPRDARSVGDFWLYAPGEVPDPLPGRVLGQLMDAWLRTLGPKDAREDPEFRSLMLSTSTELKEATPSWEHIDGVDLLGAALPPGPGGTAAPESWQFQLATDALARRILQLDPYVFEGGTLRFRAVPRGPKEQGAELMSQPLCRHIKRRDWWFSITLNISLHTVPFAPRPHLHLHWGVRRWATHPRPDTGRLNLPYHRATSVYLQPKIPWLAGAPASDRFAVARLVRDHRRDTFDWFHNDPAGMLQHLTLQERFPVPERLLAEPLDWIGDGPGVRALVVHSTRMGAHEVGPGLMPHQRSELTEWAESALPEGVVRVPDLVRRGTGVAPPANRRAKPVGDAGKKTEQLRAAAARRTALAAISRLGDAPDALSGAVPLVEARLLWQTSVFRQAAITAFAEVLGLDGDGGMSDVSDQQFDDARPGSPILLEWRTEELVLRLRCLPLTAGLGDRLLLDPAVKGKGERLAAAIKERRSALRSWLGEDGADPGHPALALVEIAHPSTFRQAGSDPKFAMRLGCADAGVLTQFAVTPSGDRQIQNENNLGHRTHNAWLDGLRQLGVRVLPEHTLGSALRDGLRYAALWMVKRRKDGPTRLPKHLPVAVLVTPLSGAPGLARVEGWDDSARTWIPYPAFLLGLVKEAEVDPRAWASPLDRTAADAGARPQQWRTHMEQQQQDTASFLHRVLHSLRGGPTVLITHAQNSRLHWPWLQDGVTRRDLIKDGHAPARRLDDELRLVRVRGRAGRETAQWWGVAKPGKANGQPAGFWALPSTSETSPSEQRVFYSTTDRPRTHAISPSLDRLSTRVNAAGKLTSQAGTGAWNPALVEITVLGCHPGGDGTGHRDRPEAIAMAMHQLRQAPDYPDALSLPLPLHLAGLAQAYVLPTFAETTETDAPEAGDVDPDLTEAASLVGEPEPEEQLSLF
ncbi:hypothetical protein GCM10010218_04390 [Streptomyces mashuensis]|uniref:DUF3893 domain-containing protein n=1 Tax=Streptomyces mashuensis TaxID=33904 RepID=A0A919AWD6_9ACTN|nr:DUF3962 domain-containing protein [Streptomyces mashuensis]GHF26620.1 hypothetical protein GCM10010218_04390 [Streptomyces mashuensis]